MNERQKKIANALAKSRNGMNSADGIAARLGYKPARNGRLAVTKTLRAMEADGLVGRIPPEDQWSCAIWCIRAQARRALSDAAEGGE